MKSRSNWLYFQGAPTKFGKTDKWKDWFDLGRSEIEIISLWAKFNRLYKESCKARGRIIREQLLEDQYHRMSKIDDKTLWASHKLAGMWLETQKRYEQMMSRPKPDMDKINAWSPTNKWVVWLQSTRNLEMVDKLNEAIVKLINLLKDNEYVKPRLFQGFSSRKEWQRPNQKIKVSQRPRINMFQSLKLDKAKQERTKLGEGIEWKAGLCMWCKAPVKRPLMMWCDTCYAMQDLSDGHDDVSIMQGNTELVEKWYKIVDEETSKPIDIKEIATSKPVIDDRDTIVDETKLEKKPKKEVVVAG